MDGSREAYLDTTLLRTWLTVLRSSVWVLVRVRCGTLVVGVERTRLLTLLVGISACLKHGRVDAWLASDPSVAPCRGGRGEEKERRYSMHDDVGALPS